MFPFERIAEIVQGERVLATEDAPIRAIHDSRLVRPGDLFVALSGCRTDGHQHLAEVFERGACGAIVSNTDVLPDNAHNLIVVNDPMRALQQLASAWRDELQTATFVAITGSNGKTTVKALLGHLLAEHRETHVSPRNYNTEIGLPLALLSMPPTSHFGIFELGAEKPGDIALLSRILRPSLGIITSIGASHLDGFDSVEAVAQEKWSLIEQLPTDGKAIINSDSQHLRKRVPTASLPVVAVGQGVGDLRGRTLQTVPNLTIALDERDAILDCALIGAHHATNVLLAAAAANTLGMNWQDIQARLTSFTPIAHRLSALPAAFGTLLDDTYNANPSSTEAALHVLATFDKTSTKVFIFGEMTGLGAQSADYHRKVAQLALSLPIHQIVPIGQAAVDACIRERDSRVSLLPRERISDHARHLAPPVTMLVKGSRHLELETLVDDLLAAT